MSIGCRGAWRSLFKDSTHTHTHLHTHTYAENSFVIHVKMGRKRHTSWPINVAPKNQHEWQLKRKKDRKKESAKRVGGGMDLTTTTAPKQYLPLEWNPFSIIFWYWVRHCETYGLAHAYNVAHKKECREVGWVDCMHVCVCVSCHWRGASQTICERSPEKTYLLDLNKSQRFFS